MKFVLMKSRGGDYLVIAQNIAWLRAAENGQTKVGIVGGGELLVVGSIEETAATITAAVESQQRPPVALGMTAAN